MNTDSIVLQRLVDMCHTPDPTQPHKWQIKIGQGRAFSAYVANVAAELQREPESDCEPCPHCGYVRP